VIVWMISKVKKLLLFCEGSGCCAGGSSVFGSVFGLWLGVFDMGYVICGNGGG
jgi:hypothetical protein